MVPYALGQKVDFVKNQGPVLDKFDHEKFLDNSKNDFTKKLESVYKAIKITRDKLDKKKSLIAFIGAPWTLLIYMLRYKKGKKGFEFNKLKKKTEEVNLVLNGLHNFLCAHIENQIEAGADVVQIFDSWAGLIPSENLPNYCYKPNLRIVNFCREKKIPVVCFPRGINENYKEFNNIVKPHGLNLDYAIDPVWAKKNLNNVVLQGGMDPKTLLSSEQKIISSAKKYLDLFKNTPYIFNLGHGLLPETDPVKVSKLIKFYRNY
jgi:uroporphyrinogen decarboxylase